MSKSAISARRLIGAVLSIIGLAIVALTFSNQLFSRAPDYEALVDDFRPVFTPESVQALRTDLAGLDAAEAEFGSTVVPVVAGAVGEDPSGVAALFGEQFPDVAQGLAAIPPLTTQFGGLADLVEAQAENFESADAIPTTSASAASIPWLLIAIGFAIALAGLAVFRSPTRRANLGAGSLGAVIVVALLALSLPSKAADADDLNTAVAPLFDPATVEAANEGLATVGAMAAQLQTEAIPAIGQMLEVPPDQLDAAVAAQFPATAAALSGLPDSSARFSGLVGLIDSNRDRYDNIKQVDFSQVINLTLIGAALSALLGFGAGLLGRRADSDHTTKG